MKHLANAITISRIFLSLSILFVKPLGIPFAVLYLACGASDILDGMIARKTNTASTLGGKLDSFADLLMVAVLLMILLPVIYLPVPIIVWILVIAGVRVVSIVVVFIKFKTFGILHTIGNKITGILLFAFPLVFTFYRSEALILLICTVAGMSAVEELAIHLFSKKLNINQKSILIK